MSQTLNNSLFVSNRGQHIWRRDTQTSSYRRGQNSVKFAPHAKLGPVSHTVLVAIMLAILGMIYLTQITKTSTYGYQLNELEAKKNALLSQKKDLEVENARLQALERVGQSSVAKALDNPVTTEYAQN